MSVRRRGRTHRGVRGVLGFLLLGCAAVVGVAVALDTFTTGGPQRPVCTVDAPSGHVRLEPMKMANASLITGVGIDHGVGQRAIVIALATAMQESSLRNLDYGDRDSLGLFQQRPSQGWGTAEEVQDEVYATSIFYDRLLEVPGYETMPLTEAAQAVQISAFPEAYAKHEALAQSLHDALTGEAPRSLDCSLPASSGLDYDRLLDGLSRAYPSARVVPAGPGLNLQGEVDPWALAHWAIATAHETGVSQVQVGTDLWSRGPHSRGEDPREPGWQEATTAVAGVVVR